jgi:hypothetical protein
MDGTRTLEKLGACEAAVEWIQSLGPLDPQTSWDTCQRGDWLLWLVVRLGLPAGIDLAWECAHRASAHAHAAGPFAAAAADAAANAAHAADAAADYYDYDVYSAYRNAAARAYATYRAHAADAHAHAAYDAETSAIADLVRHRVTWAEVARAVLI